jgi:hypothetical protein
MEEKSIINFPKIDVIYESNNKNGKKVFIE